MHDDQPERDRTPTEPTRPYDAPRVARFGTFRQITRQGLSGTVDGGLILGADGSTTPAADLPGPGGSR